MTDIQKSEAVIKSKDRVAFAWIGQSKSVAKICAEFATAHDERCTHPDDFNGYMFGIKSHSTMPGAPLIGAVLVPKSEPELHLLDIVKLRLDGFRPAYFEMLAARRGDDDCKFITNWPGASGVTCPKYNWDFRKDLNL